MIYNKIIIESQTIIMQKSNCIETCKGIIKEIKIKGMDFPSKIIVEFEVSGKIYTINYTFNRI